MEKTSTMSQMRCAHSSSTAPSTIRMTVWGEEQGGRAGRVGLSTGHAAWGLQSLPPAGRLLAQHSAAPARTMDVASLQTCSTCQPQIDSPAQEGGAGRAACRRCSGAQARANACCRST